MSKGYKRFVKVFVFATVLMLALVGCSSKETETSYFSDANGIETTLTYYAKGDTVTKQTTKSVMPYSLLQVSTEEEARAILEPLSEEFQGVEGLEQSIEYTKLTIIETVSVDYTIADLEEISKLQGTEFEGDTKGRISLKKSIKLLEGLGYTKVED